MISSLRRTLTLLLPTLLVFSCTSVKPSASDSSPPNVVLNVFDIPLQPGASSQDNPEWVTGTCCDISRMVKPGVITLLASAKDSESGIQELILWAVLKDPSCTPANPDDDEIGTIEQPLTGPAAQTSIPLTTPPQESFPEQLLVSYKLQIPARPPQCTSYSSNWDTYAEGKNSKGAKMATKHFLLQIRLP
jgi:hypothetical protein